LANSVADTLIAWTCPGRVRWRKALTAGIALAFVTSVVGTADAAVRKSSRSLAISKLGKKRDVPIKEPFGELPRGPLQMVVSIGQQQVTLYANGVRIAQSKVSTGTASHPTPTGVFSVIEKDRWHRSNLYDNAPMFYMQRLTWSGVAMHEGALPGYPASHGCIRLPTDFASRLWVVTKLGVRIVVAHNDPVPYELDHPSLFSPRQRSVARLSEAQPVEGLRSTVAATDARPIVLAQAAMVDDSGHMTDIIDQTPSAPPQDDGASPAARPAQPAETASAPADVETTAATPAPQPAEAPAVAPAAAVEAAPGAEPEKRAPVEAEPRKPAPPRNRAGEPTKRAGQVAVFVSKREKKIFVRQGFIPLFDMPVEIADPDQPLGTHVFTAMEVQEDGTRMRWNAITMPPERPRPVDVRGKKAGSKKAEPAPTASTKTPSTAAEALDRIKMPQEAIDRIAELLPPGSSLVVSDHGLGRETGRYTEFIVVTQ